MNREGSLRTWLRPWLAWGCKLIIGVAIFAFVVRQIDPSQWVYVKQHKFIAAIPVLGWTVNQIFTSLRLNIMLRALNLNVCLSAVLKANFASLFLGNLMPGSVGADVIKFFYLRGSDERIPASKLVFVLALDRVLGLCAILVWCVVASFLIVAPDNNELWFVYLPHIFLLLLLISFFMGHLFTVRLGDKLTTPIIKTFVGAYREIVSIRSSRFWFLIIVYNMAAVFVLVLSLVYVGGDLLHMDGLPMMYAEQFFLIPLSLVVAMLPLTPAGIGTVQVAMGFVYPLLSLPASVGIAVTTLSQLGLVLVSVFLGLPYFLKARKG